MSMKNIFTAAVLTVAVFSTAVIAQEGPLESLLDVYRVDTSDVNGEQVENLVATDAAVPGEVLEYVLTYRNRGESGLQGFVIKNRVPANTQYLAESDMATIGADFLVSIDQGVTWEDVPVTRVVTDSEGREQVVVIPASQYTNVSWRVTEVLSPSDEFELRYRVQIQ